jgi:hypothetical protein
MIKKIIKILSIIIVAVVLVIFYLSFVGIKTTKFNKKLSDRILEINKKINVDLKDVKFLLDPYNFSVNVTTKDPVIRLKDNKLQIKSIKTNLSLKSLIYNEFSIDDLQISTKEIKLNDLILLVRSFKNSTELFLLDKIIKDGLLTADIKLKFEDSGKISDDYKINGFIRNTKFNFFNKFIVKNLNLEFNIDKKEYLFSKIKANFNDLELSSSLIEVVEKKNLFLIKGIVLTEEKNFNKSQPNILFNSFFKDLGIEEAKLSSVNNFFFNINKKLKVNDLNINSKVNLDQLSINNKFINLKTYLPNSKEVTNFENHKITINYSKDLLEIKGNGEVLIEDKFDFINYKMIKNKDKFTFDTKINLKNSKLVVDFLDYEKNNNSDTLISIKGKFKKNREIKFDLISLVEKNNKILFKNLNLDKDFKIMNIDSFIFDYLNNKKIKNQILLERRNSNYTIEGVSFDATKLINLIMDSDDENSSLFSNLNSKINLKVNKIYIDEVNFINNLLGKINFKNNEIDYLDFKSTFPNSKKITLLIENNNQQEKITKLFTDFPKPLIKRYNFIEGFEEGFLDYYSIKKDGTSNSLLVIDDFKVKKVPVFAKILSLASLQGIADLLTGEGIRFTDFEMKFSNRKGLTTIEEMYAIGPAVSILMDGYIESNKLISLNGTLVPATTINRSIASIPILGDILIGKKTGEGVFGVSYKIKGTKDNLETTVNPIKTLTPRFITRTLEKIKKN